MTLLIKNAAIAGVEPEISGTRDIFIKDGLIKKIDKEIKEEALKTIDARGKIIIPGIVDMHVHLREPGREDKETVLSGTRAGLSGGVTAMLAMPNTTPAIDSVERVELLKGIIKKSAQAHVCIAGAISLGRQGKLLTDIAALKKAGVSAITDDGSSLDSLELFSKALRIAKKHDMLVICHCENTLLSRSGVINLGATSTMLGLRGISKESEYKRVERDVALAQKEQCPIHIAHVSCAESVEIIARAKKKKAAVSAETAPHYFSLDETALMGYNTNMKINPPLRTKNDVEAIKQALRDGVIDVIASDHAPHSENEKDIEFDRAACGTIGLETMLAVSITELIVPGILSWESLVKKLCFNPARLLKLKKKPIQEGVYADLVLVDPEKEWIVDKQAVRSCSKNSAFLGKKLKGSVDCVVFGDRIVFKASNVL